jgi:hypothetical protein
MLKGGLSALLLLEQRSCMVAGNPGTLCLHHLSFDAHHQYHCPSSDAHHQYHCLSFDAHHQYHCLSSDAHHQDRHAASTCSTTLTRRFSGTIGHHAYSTIPFRLFPGTLGHLAGNLSSFLLW